MPKWNRSAGAGGLSLTVLICAWLTCLGGGAGSGFAAAQIGSQRLGLTLSSGFGFGA